jgi:EAL domain-containing protein (putative c-di-GMP-specific phosphodiesterase class I)
VVAEGSETVERLQKLHFSGREFGRGYLFSLPVPEEKARRFIVEPFPLSLKLAAGYSLLGR